MNILRKLATEWNKRFDEDARAAKRELVRYIKERDEVLAQVLDEIVIVAVRDAIHADVHHERKKRWDSITPKIDKDAWVPPPADGKETVPIPALQRRFTTPEVVWMDYPYVNNKKLKHAKKGELEEESTKFGKAEDTMRERKEFYSEVATRMPDYNQTVEQCLTEGIIRRIAEKRQNIFLNPPKPVGSGSTDSAAV